tara:strand:+ start:1016 stop:1933 length:918 start_codon:yes stop_codon:yes gene_type:complete
MNSNKRIDFSRSAVVIVGLLLISMIVFNFFIVHPKGDITNGLIVIILLLITVALSESFDNFSVFNLLSLTRENKQKEKTITDLKTENIELRGSIVKLTTSIVQTQTSTNIIGFPHEELRKAFVLQASEDEIEEKENENKSNLEAQPLEVQKKLDYRIVEQSSISKYIDQNNYGEFNLIRDAKLVSQFDGIDPICGNPPIFDGYINTYDSEIFIEVKNPTPAPMILRDRLYFMLNKIYLYNKISSSKTYLVLLVPDIKTEEVDLTNRDPNKFIDKLSDYFAPAIASGLLRLRKIDFDYDESNDFVK